MGVPKGTDNFKSFRTKKSEANLQALKDALSKARKRKRVYSSLSEIIAEMQDLTGLHRTTLSRNPLYQNLLRAYLVAQPGAAARLPVLDAPPEVLRAKLIDMEMEIERLNREKNINGPTQPRAANERQLESGKPTSDHTDWYVAFANTAATLLALIDALNKEATLIKVDVQAGEILDKSEPDGRQLIVGGERARAFIQYYRKFKEQQDDID
ncbi:hypothetical protein MasN3_16110 [Massilia varians]|uniref:Uncharacterized protein n=1 Tax=Massilia varians TaxID=457921 RepID=A0ABN6T7A9_9BURK|nr:hypothetical protein [Massilia varians]BDT58117.1 hypothetical protein MasN3_16110 [Massilia varians]